MHNFLRYVDIPWSKDSQEIPTFNPYEERIVSINEFFYAGKVSNNEHWVRVWINTYPEKILDA